MAQHVLRFIVQWVNEDGHVARRLRIPVPNPEETKVEWILQEAARRVGEDVGDRVASVDGAELDAEDIVTHALEVGDVVRLSSRAVMEVPRSLPASRLLMQPEEEEDQEAQPMEEVEEVEVVEEVHEPVEERQGMQHLDLGNVEEDDEEEGDAGTMSIRMGVPHGGGLRAVRVPGGAHTTLAELQKLMKVRYFRRGGTPPDVLTVWKAELPLLPQHPEVTTLEELGVEDGEVLYAVGTMNPPPQEQEQDAEGEQVVEEVQVLGGGIFQFTKVPAWDAPIKQTDKGMDSFLSCLVVLAKKFVKDGEADSRANFIGHLARLAPFPPLLHTFRLMCSAHDITDGQRAAVSHGLFHLFRAMVPADVATDDKLFEHSRTCLGYVEAASKPLHATCANFRVENLICDLSFARLVDPVKVDGAPGQDSVFSRGQVLSAVERQEEGDADWLKQVTPARDIHPYVDAARWLAATPVNKTDVVLWMPEVKVMECAGKAPSLENVAWKTVEGLAVGCLHLKVYAGLALKEAVAPCLSLYVANEGDEPRLLASTREPRLGGSGVVDHTRELFDPVTGGNIAVNPDDLARLLPEELCVNDGGPIRLAPPVEVTMVCIDQSFSMADRVPDMSDSGDDDPFRRIDMVKALFGALADRSMAYFGQDHWIGLIRFGRNVEVTVPPTPFYVEFQERVDEIVPNGLTALHEALFVASQQLQVIRGKYPHAKMRVLALTDGYDSGWNRERDPGAFMRSSGHLRRAINNLRELNSPVDCVILGDMESATLRAAAVATGGTCFNPLNLQEGLRIFQQEAMLALSQRRAEDMVIPDSIPNDINLLERLGKPREGREWDYAKLMRCPQPAQLRGRVTSSLSAVKRVRQVGIGPMADALAAHLARVEKEGEQFVPKRNMILKVLQELEAFHGEHREDLEKWVKVLPSEDNIFFWRVLMMGPPDSVFEDACFVLYIRFTAKYPEVAPEVRFVTRVHHPNINSAGRVCHSIFTSGWNREVEIHVALSLVRTLLREPEPDHPLDSAVALQYNSDRRAYEREARRVVEMCARRSMQQLESALLNPEEAEEVPVRGRGRRGRGRGRGRRAPPKKKKEDEDPPEHLLDPIMRTLMLTDTVVTPQGHTFLRESLERWVRANSACPLTRLPLTMAELNHAPRNRALEGEAAEWLRGSGREGAWYLAAAEELPDREEEEG